MSPCDGVVSQEGDICDETGGKRSVKTAITCCSTDPVDPEGQQKTLAVLVSIQVIKRAEGIEVSFDRRGDGTRQVKCEGLL